MAKVGPLMMGKSHSDVNHCKSLCQFWWPEGHQEPINNVDSLSPTKCTGGFDWKPSKSIAMLLSLSNTPMVQKLHWSFPMQEKQFKLAFNYVLIRNSLQGHLD